MADLKIYNDIQSEDTKDIVRFWGGVEGTSFKDIDEFVSSIPEDDADINIKLHCNGGEVLEGLAIYDKLRSTGKTISATVEGTCASMATIILLSAQKDKRKAYKNAEILVHEPYMAYQTTHGTAEELRRASEEMQHIEDKLIDIYVDRTDADRDTIVELMHDGKFIGADKAMEIGLISTIVEPISAKRVDNNIFNQTQENMATDEIKVKRSLWEKVLSALGLGESEAETEQVMDANDANQVEEEAKPLNLTLETADGATLTVEREDGEPQVGDKASPDGEHQMPDGKTIIVTDGEITEIREPETEETEPEPDAKDLEIADLKAQIEDLTSKIADLESKQKSESDTEILNYVESVGGMDGLRKMVSKHVPQERTDTEASPLNKQDEDSYRNRIDEIRQRILDRNKRK